MRALAAGAQRIPRVAVATPPRRPCAGSPVLGSPVLLHRPAGCNLATQTPSSGRCQSHFWRRNIAALQLRDLSLSLPIIAPPPSPSPVPHRAIDRACPYSGPLAPQRRLALRGCDAIARRFLASVGKLGPTTKRSAPIWLPWNYARKPGRLGYLTDISAISTAPKLKMSVSSAACVMYSVIRSTPYAVFAGKYRGCHPAAVTRSSPYWVLCTKQWRSAPCFPLNYVQLESRRFSGPQLRCCCAGANVKHAQASEHNAPPCGVLRASRGASPHNPYSVLRTVHKS